MDDNIVSPIEMVKAILALILILAGFVFAGTMDYEEEVRHEQWMQDLKESGAWVMW